MKPTRRLLLATCALLCVSATAFAASVEPVQVQLTVSQDAAGPRIEPEIYGQFAEHLGAGIYGGLWVGPKSKIPNTRGWRNDVVQALKRLEVPVVRWPGGCLPTTTTGAMASATRPNVRCD